MRHTSWPAVLVTLAVLAVVEHASADLYVVGVGAGCTHATVQAAVDDGALTSEADTILVARNTTYNGQAISINNQSLTILGGVPNCVNFVPNGRTVLSGAGGSADPVIRITGSGNVTLSRIDLTGGDETSTGLGGGLFFHGSGVLRLEEMNIINNRAGSGGGIYARGTSSTAELFIGANVLINSNTAVRNGGGIDAVDIRLTMTSPGSAVFLNTATGRIVNNEFVDGDGGGIQCFGCQARIGTATALGTIFLNTAYGRGGGLAIFAKDAQAGHLNADLFTSVATSPLVISGNSAGMRGGAIYAESNLSAADGAFNVVVRLWDAIVRDNLAPEGAAVFLKGDGDVFEDTRAELRMGVGTRPAGAEPCAAASQPCNRISGNESRDLYGVATNGAILEATSADTVFQLEHVVLEDNVGRSLLRKSSGPSCILRGCLLTGNTVSEELIQNVTSKDLVINHCTITGNQVGGSHVVFAEADTVIGHSIIWQPGKKVLRRTNTGAYLNVRNLLVNDIDGLPPQVDILSAATPGFVSAADHDYHLRSDSVAVDFAQYAFGTQYDMARDLDGGLREVDLPEIPNEFGPRDLGAYEMQTLLDLIFKDGFESGDLTAWSGAAIDGGDLFASPGSAMVGARGLQGVVDDTAGIYVQDDSPFGEDRYRARFYFDTNGFDPGEAFGRRRTRLFIGFAEAPVRRLLAVVLRRLNGQYSLRGRARLDDDSQADTSFFPIADGPHVVEIEWRRSTGPDADTGFFRMWIDGNVVSTLYTLDNSIDAVDFVRMGALSVKAGASGTLLWDAFESRRQTYIGPVP